jgi:2-oxoglutarate dehydrogenase E2 component (dihydrolipoamide succinyltransferase)
VTDGVDHILMPQMGVSVTEGTVTAWHKRTGERVRADEPVCAISTDKVDTEVVAPSDGILGEILLDVGEIAAIGAPLAELRRAEVTASARETSSPPATFVPPKAPAMPGTVVQPVPAPFDAEAMADAAVPPGIAVAASPVARRIAAEHRIDLGKVPGTGVRGRIRKADVIAELGAPVARAPLVPAVPQSSAPAPIGVIPRGYANVPYRAIPTSATRRAIAKHMTRSRQTAAHMTTEVEVDMRQVGELRAALNESRLEAQQATLSVLPFVARAACSALRDHPNFNATYADEVLLQWTQVNLSIAVDTDRGLLAPVIRSCETLNVVEIAERIADLAARARTDTLTPEDMQGGTFTLSNPGSVGASSAMAIINQPQVAILGVPAIVKRPVVVSGDRGEDLVAIRPMMQLALTFDHRAADGAEATRCAVAIKHRLEDWDIKAYV